MFVHNEFQRQLLYARSYAKVGSRAERRRVRHRWRGPSRRLSAADNLDTSTRDAFAVGRTRSPAYASSLSIDMGKIDRGGADLLADATYEGITNFHRTGGGSIAVTGYADSQTAALMTWSTTVMSSTEPALALRNWGDRGWLTIDDQLWESAGQQVHAQRWRSPEISGATLSR